ncbi:MAG: M23 family metallopeptidase [Bdellovibrionales bacterium]|nr:M23 family metallopeptidase [Bdellovibrionales bacterium]NQZ18348.1 M23 family metallopeptidase [Bdellovibrionales bacterium]
MSSFKNFGFLFLGSLLLGIFLQSETHALPSRQPGVASAGNGGYLTSPVCGCSHCITTSGFGPRWGRMHTGHDFDCRMGDPIRASSSGVVRSVGRQGGYGLRVEIQRQTLLRLASGGQGFNDDQDLETSYSHLSRASIRPGQRVRAGDFIGYCGNTGRSVSRRGGDGTHLHYEVRVDGRPMNPTRFFRGTIQSNCPSSSPRQGRSTVIEV